MADYKELLRRAVEALPENNGAARRAVYEKARAALVGQLRAINPPLPARDITTHRLQLEDCIRQVEQEASEANIAGMTQDSANHADLPPVFAARPKAKPAAEPKPEPAPQPAPKPAAEAKPKPKAPPPPAEEEFEEAEHADSIEDIIAAAVGEEVEDAESEPVAARPQRPEPRRPSPAPVLVAKSPAPAREQMKPEPQQRPAAAAAGRPAEARPLPSIVARAEAAKGRSTANLSVAVDNPRRGPTIEPRSQSRTSVAAIARQPEPVAFELPEDLAAMTAVSEVEVEPQSTDPQGAIDRAIATLDREARGDSESHYDGEPEIELDDEPMQAPPPPRKKSNANSRRVAAEPSLVGDNDREPKRPRPAREFANPRRASRGAADGPVPRAREERGGIGAVTIFLGIFAVLLLGAGGAGFWAWQEGFINLDAMFGKGETPVVAATAEPVVTPDSTGPGNTATPTTTAQPSTELKADERLTPDEPQVAAATTSTTSVAPLALQSPTGDKTEERLGGASASAETAEEAVAAIDPASVAGSQSLLLEAQDNGTTGAVPFSGTVSWSKGVDELGQPTLVGKANIPARNLSVDVLIRKNGDPSLPASHLMEINFTVSDTFIGGSIAGLPGVLLKNEELVQGAPLVGASARVVGNSFLFALSASPEDSQANVSLLTSRKWMDLALIYASGKRAIITLEKDDKAQKLFSDVFAAWSKTASN